MNLHEDNRTKDINIFIDLNKREQISFQHALI